jgi:Family of unknown function (DUF5678)
MLNNPSRRGRFEEAREVLRAAQREDELLAANPEILTNYAGQWVVVLNGQVVAHAVDGAELAKIAPISKYPHAVVHYVPSLEEQEGILILGLDRAEESAS